MSHFQGATAATDPIELTTTSLAASTSETERQTRRYQLARSSLPTYIIYQVLKLVKLLFDIITCPTTLEMQNQIELIVALSGAHKLNTSQL